MKIILLSDVKNVGKKDQIVQVADGYGRNYLIRNGLAVEATKTSVKILDKEKEDEIKHQQQLKAQALEEKARLEKIRLTYKVKAGVEGKMFGSVSTARIAETLGKDYGITVDKRKFTDTAGLTSLGKQSVRIELYKGVFADVKVDVLPEE